MHFFSRYSYIWKFDSDQEREYSKFVLASNVTSLRLVTFITLFGMSLFLLIDYFKDVDFSYVLGSRIIVLSGASIIMWLTYKGLSARGIVISVSLIVVLNFGASLVTAKLAGMPSFYLTNLLFLIFLLVVTASGLHFRQALIVNTICLITFLMYSNFIKIDHFYFSQYPHLFSIFLYIHIVGIVLESRRRRNFLQFKELELQSRLVDDLNQQKNKVISVLSHDVASPLNSLSALLYMQTKGEITEKELRPYFSELSEELNNVSLLLNGLIRWSRSQMKGFVLDKVPVNLHEIIENKKKLFQSQLKAKDLQLIIETDPLARIRADEDMIRIAIHNIVSNAIKFSKNGTSIRFIISRNGNNKVQVHVINIGESIPEEAKDKLFTFQMRSMADTNGGRGAGLGLALSAFFVRLNDGDIYLAPSAEGKTTFCIELPLDNGKQ
ncbi:MAG TPA: sensor histidine kinase [Cyclobacteriaceae bacterium]